MRNTILYGLILVSFASCNGFGLREKKPNRDGSVSCFYLREAQENYHLFSKLSTRHSEFFNDSDTVTIDGVLYDELFFAKIIKEDLHKNFNDYNLNPTFPNLLYYKGSFERKKIPGEDRAFLVLEEIVGVE
ncbi:hypothetical protein [Arcticibacterium luteifluviistationis]|uniref:Lipoprotein n=1 Tax=Arcticibacterium luteifluviistationis TaxID=1784714 RepID=A0A2Z4G8K4_9BACT|nr:hypothetical protein [Arcticibacterium luteifluviistationis]AWV97527.1 hypothetical protein DJ013_04845 [Arcticibacterium luteifluviistationis]